MSYRCIVNSIACITLVLLIFDRPHLVCAQSHDERAARLVDRLNKLPEEAAWKDRGDLLLKIARVFEKSSRWEEAKRSIKYRREVSQLFESYADLSIPQPDYHSNQFMLRFFETLERKSAGDAAAIWERVRQREEISKLFARRKYREIVPAAKSLKKFFQEQLGEDSYWAVMSAADEVVAQIYLSRIPTDAEAVLKKAIEISSNEKSKYTPEHSFLHFQLVSVFNSQRRFSDSIALMERCLPAVATFHGEKNPRTLQMRTVKANTLRAAGRTNEARRTLLDVIDAVSILDSPYQSKMFVESSLAVIELEMIAGNTYRALALCEALYENRGSYSGLTAVRLDWMTRILMQRVQLLATIDDRDTLEKSAKALADHLPKTRMEWVRSRATFRLAHAHIKLAELDKAEQYFLEIKDDPQFTAHTGSVDLQLARIERMRGNLEEAERQLRGLLETHRIHKSREYHAIAVWRELGFTYHRMGDRENELKCFQKCLDLELEEQARKNQHLSRVDQLATAWRAYRSYYLVLQTMHDAVAGLDANKALERFLMTVEACEDAPSYNLKQYLQKVPPGTAVVQFIDRRTFHLPSDGNQEFVSGNRCSAFVIRRKRTDESATVTWFEVGSTGEVFQSCEAWSDAITQCLPTSSTRGIRSLRLKKERAAATAGEEFQKRLRPLLRFASQDVQQIVICPTGALWGVPWNALQLEPNGPYLIKSCQVNVETNCSQALQNLTAQGVEPRVRKMTLVYDLDFGTPVPDRLQFKPLPATKQEAEKVLRDCGTNKVDLFSGKHAQKSRILESIRTSNVAYFATHVHSSLPSHVSTESPNDRLVKRMLQSYRNDSDAFHYQSIVLSSANQLKPGKSVDDHKLLASEVSMLDLPNLDLVVLSTCSSAAGFPVAGLGNCGAQRAFHLAGSKTVIGSLWPVEDKATRQLMSNFSEFHFKQGRPASESLRLAILKQMDSTPFHLWAGWTVLGR